MSAAVWFSLAAMCMVAAFAIASTEAQVVMLAIAVVVGPPFAVWLRRVGR